MIRLIAGKYKGRKIEQPPLEITRPTTDRIREAIFSSIQFKIKNSIILDLFSGSGSMAIEAISRGAMKAFAIDNDKNAIKTIEKNINLLDIKNISVFKTNAINFLNSNKGIKFDLIFLDPPYKEYDLYNEIIFLLKSESFLSLQGLIICETDDYSKISLPKGFVIQKMKKYGKSYILTIANNI